MDALHFAGTCQSVVSSLHLSHTCIFNQHAQRINKESLLLLLKNMFTQRHSLSIPQHFVEKTLNHSKQDFALV